MPRSAAFAIPGDIDQKTGGYIYEKSLLLALRAAGRRVDHIQLPTGFPLATPEDTAMTLQQLAAVPPDVPLILDGLVYGGIETAALAEVRAPLVAMIHHPVGLETGLEPHVARMLLAREAANLALAAHVVVPSPHTARILTADFGVEPARISIAPPGFARPDPVRDPADPPLILTVGLIAERKGHDVLLSALAEVADLRWQAQIVGGTHDAALLDRLVAQRATLGLSARVAFRGRLEERELATLYRQATVFALATRYEGYGMVFGEALLHGLPIVTCDGGAVPETVPPGAGLIVPVGDASGFADALRAVLSDDDLRTRLTVAAAAAGNRLPAWSATAAVMGKVLDSV